MNLFGSTVEINYQVVILGIIGGLGIFLYGIHIMGESLKNLAGERLKYIIGKYTDNPFKGLLIGFIATLIVQSSSGATVITISLIRAGLMTLPQAIGIIMGANIGTTATAFIIGLKMNQFALLFVGIGAGCIFFFKNRRTSTVGMGILGLGLLFFGMETMSIQLKTLAAQGVFDQHMARFSEFPLFSIFSGAAITSLVQSSSATTGVVQGLYESGAIELRGALPLIIGNNIGTTITAVLAAIGGSIAAKRASAFHVLFNVLGAIVFLILLNPYYNAILWISNTFDISKEMEIAFAHIIFNFTMAFLFIWFVKQCEWVLVKIIPGKDPVTSNFNEELLNEALIDEYPILSLETSKQAILYMATTVEAMLKETIAFAENGDLTHFETSNDLEKVINDLDFKIHHYLMKLTGKFERKQTNVLSRYIDTVKDLERIGDHCENINEVFKDIYNKKSVLSSEAWKDFSTLYHRILAMFHNVIAVIEKEEKRLAREVIQIEETVDRFEKKARRRHSMRVNEGVCHPNTQMAFIDLLTNLERIGDHCTNIANYTLDEGFFLIIE